MGRPSSIDPYTLESLYVCCEDEMNSAALLSFRISTADQRAAVGK